ncbi:hypothetical protein BDK51DRAFT_43541 [Blyttiomyces helicus]|uniref:Armadillo-type protein n=1 Tax=Blyttiomyces helicus TaxID=388810 RepID=A0A4P9WQ11_9FUNG|nr:hypothetical protein BDK51DRAFT_43541 [Blyttiomyces helicus]|eukprot:RKO94652.1 hypothetical protein BDK51DRAFT_43541 [Blyttiomyces helicus]
MASHLLADLEGESDIRLGAIQDLRDQVRRSVGRQQSPPWTIRFLTPLLPRLGSCLDDPHPQVPLQTLQLLLDLIPLRMHFGESTGALMQVDAAFTSLLPFLVPKIGDARLPVRRAAMQSLEGKSI